MTTTTDTSKRQPGAAASRRAWYDWVGYAAAAWAASYAVMALIWTVTGRWFPFGRGDPDSFGVLRDLPTDVGAPVFAAALTTTTVLALVMSAGWAPRPRAVPRRLLLGAGSLVAGALLIVVPEPSVLALAGYAPLLLVGAPFGWPPIDYSQVFTWPLLNQAYAILGGFLVAATVVAWQRRTRGACGASGRRDTPATWTAPDQAARWGRWAVLRGGGRAVALRRDPVCVAVQDPAHRHRRVRPGVARQRRGMGRHLARLVRGGGGRPHVRAGAPVGGDLPAMDGRPGRSPGLRRRGPCSECGRA